MNQELIQKLLADKRIQLVAVSKKHTRKEIDEMAKLGVDTFGENRVQEFLEKYTPEYHWHIIGHLQTNKVKYIVGKVDLIESVDSVRLADEIEKQAAKQGIIQDVLVEVRISETDIHKTGTPLNELDSLLQHVNQLDHVRLKGLMTIATNTDDKTITEAEFKKVKQLFDHYQSLYPGMSVLSMGMSNDYELAIENGSSQVRIGTALFS